MNRLLLSLGILALVVSGCVSKSEAQAQAKAAYEAGRAQAYQQMLDSQRTGIRIIGDVKKPQIQWENGLTLAKVLVQAEWNGLTSPSQITIVRRGKRTPVDVHALLRGKDVPLEPGDTVELLP